MNNFCRKLLLGLVLAGGALTFGSGTTAQADDYWNRHWGWYDNSYRPYYHRNYYYSNPNYGNPYGNPNYGYQRGYYSRPYYRSYNYGPGYYGGGGVQVGPLTFGWW